MGHFSKIDIEVGSVTYSYNPYDRGANGAFVFREAGVAVHAPRVVVSTSTNDAGSDKMAVQLNHPRVCASAESCGPETILGTDLVKTELRFLATTTASERSLAIDKHIALLQELRGLSENRDVMYS